MTTQSIIRLGGIAALLGGATSILSSVGAAFGLVPAAADGYRSLATLLISLFALTAIYAAQADRAGKVGLLGYVLGTLGLAGNVGLRFVFVLVAPILLAQFPEAAQAAGAGPLAGAISITFLVYTLGYIAFGIATWRARVFARWAGLLLAVGALLSYVLIMLPFNLGGLLVNAGILWMGWSLTAPRMANTAQVRFQTVG